jgi:uncharacterized protein
MKLSVLLRVGAIVGLVANCLVAAPGSAQQPTPAALAAAREMLDTRGSMTLFDPVVRGVIERVKNSLLPTNLNVARELNEVAAQLQKDYDPRRAELAANITRIFAQHFTERELRDLTAFYKTPLGQKLVKEDPVAVQESLTEANRWANEFSDTVMARFRAEMQKRGHPI